MLSHNPKRPLKRIASLWERIQDAHSDCPLTIKILAPALTVVDAIRRRHEVQPACCAIDRRRNRWQDRSPARRLVAPKYREAVRSSGTGSRRCRQSAPAAPTDSGRAASGRAGFCADRGSPHTRRRRRTACDADKFARDPDRDQTTDDADHKAENQLASVRRRNLGCMVWKADGSRPSFAMVKKIRLWP